MADVSTEAVTIRREDCGAFWQVAAWPDTLGPIAARIGEVMGVEAPGPGELAQTDKGQIARIGPLAWWVIGAQGDTAHALADIVPEQGAALDLTGNRVRFAVSGPHARDMMMRLAPLDFRDRSFPAGRIAATTAHHMSVQIARRDDAWDVYITTTFADALAELLEETAEQWA